MGKLLQQTRTVFGFLVTFLLKLNNMLTNLPVGLHQNGIHLLNGVRAPLRQTSRNVANQLLIRKIAVELDFHLTLPVPIG